MPIVRLNDVVKTYRLGARSVRALDGVDLQIDEPGFYGIMGPSGSGKSTLLHLLAALDRPDTGQVEVAGERLDTMSEHDLTRFRRRRIGIVFQQFNLIPTMTALDNVALPAMLDGMPAAERTERARGLLESLGLMDRAGHRPDALSGGEQQRVALARAIVPRPAVVLMDEPFSGLDQRLRESVREETLAVLRETRASCLLVTHDPVEAMWMADRIVVMRNGYLVQMGTPAEIYRHPADVETARFFSDFNELYGTVEDGLAATPLGNIEASAFGSGDRVLIMIRPQGLQPVEGANGVEGMVTDVRFLGDANVLSVAVHGCDDPLSVRVSGTIFPEKGAIMRFELNREHVLVFPAGEGTEEKAGDGYQESQ